MQPYDIIVIGSGMGGLTFASLMAQMAHKRVLVLEHHFKLGCFTHTFTRKGYTWDVGLHYVGGMNKGTSSRTMCDFVTHSAVKWHKLPGAFEQFVYPDFTFVVIDDPKEYSHDLIQQFPAEETGCGLPIKMSSSGRLLVNGRLDSLWVKTIKWFIGLQGSLIL